MAMAEDSTTPNDRPTGARTHVGDGLEARIARPPVPHHDSITQQRAIGALLGAAVGDALGAPFEFRPPGEYSRTFTTPVVGGTGELTGGGSFNWAPGEFTDDTQMAVALAHSLIACDGFDADDLWARFVAWRRSAPDVGLLTGRVLAESDWPDAARRGHLARDGRSAANGSLMRVTPIAIAWSGATEVETMHAARAQSALTHFDPAAGWGAAIGAAMIRRAILGDDPIASIPAILERVDPAHVDRFATMLSPDWHPGLDGHPGNGSVWTCLAQAVWAVRTNDDLHDALVAAIDLGGDTDTVATVTGAVAGARGSVQAIPSRWLTYVNGSLSTPDGEVRLDNAALQDLARALLDRGPVSATPEEPDAGPTAVAPRLHAANLGGARTVPTGWAVISLCRTFGGFDGHPLRREVYLIDQSGPANADPVAAVRDAVDSIDAFLAEGHDVVVHCHGGHSRTGLVLKAWAMRTYGFDEREAHDWLLAQWPHYEDHQTSFVELLRNDWP